MIVIIVLFSFYFFSSVESLSSTLSVRNSREETSQQDVNHNLHKEDTEMSNIIDLMKANSLYLKFSNDIVSEIDSSEDESPDQNTIYDIIFWSYFTLYVSFVVYTRAKTHYRIDYPDSDWSFFSLVTTYRKAIAPDGSIDRDLRKAQDEKLFSNIFLIALVILWFGLSFCNYDEILSEPKKHIEGIYELLSAMFRYSLYILGVCYLFDVCVALPYCYYE